MPEPPLTRPTLLVRIRDAGDAEAWRQFLELYAPIVFGFYRGRGLQDADAADLTQDVMHAVASGAERLEYDPERGSFRGWLRTVARNKLVNFLDRRRRTPQARGDASTQELIASIPTADDADAWDREYEQRVFSLAAEFVQTRVDGPTWRAFWLTAVEGRSGQDVARSLGLSVGAVYVAKSRVLTRLKQRVEELQGE